MIAVTGFEKVAKRLLALPPKFQKKVVRKSTRQAAKHFRDRVREHTPKITGKLRRNIMHEEYKATRTSVQFVVHARGGELGVSKNDKKNAYYARWVEWGNYGHAGKHFMGGTYEMYKKKIALEIRYGVRVAIAGIRNGRL